MLFLLRCRFWKSNPWRLPPMPSPVRPPGISILIAVAPQSTSCRTQVGPARARVRSSTVNRPRGSVAGLMTGPPAAGDPSTLSRLHKPSRCAAPSPRRLPGRRSGARAAGRSAVKPSGTARPQRPEVVDRPREVGGGARLVDLVDGEWRGQGRRRQERVDVGERRGEGPPMLLALRQRQQVVARRHVAAELDPRADVRVDGQALVVHEVAHEAIALGADDAAGGGGVVGEAMRQRGADDLARRASRACRRPRRRRPAPPRRRPPAPRPASRRAGGPRRRAGASAADRRAPTRASADRADRARSARGRSAPRPRRSAPWGRACRGWRTAAGRRRC